MAYETEKLEARIIERYGTQKRFAEAMGMTTSALSRILSTGRDWKGSKLIKAVELLDIPHNEINDYFFVLRVEKRQPKGAKK